MVNSPAAGISLYTPSARELLPYVAEAVRLLAQHTEQLNINTDAVAAWKEISHC